MVQLEVTPSALAYMFHGDLNMVADPIGTGLNNSTTQPNLYAQLRGAMAMRRGMAMRRSSSSNTEMQRDTEHRPPTDCVYSCSCQGLDG